MNCCNKNNQKKENKKNNKEKGFLNGLILGLIPHIGCIGFIIFSILGVATATAFFKPLLLNPYFFHVLVAISFVFATISAMIYLKKNGLLSFQGLKRKKGYLSILYGTTIGINLFLFMFIFPVVANIDSSSGLTASMIRAFGSGDKLQLSETSSLITLQVDIPCSGHAPLITEELKKISGIESVRFRFPNLFDVNYLSLETSQEQIISLEIFNIYKAVLVYE
jgi:hypothetical protein